MLKVLAALLVTLLIGYLIFKSYKTQTVLFLGGILLMSLSIIFKTGEIMPQKSSTGFVWFDMFEYIRSTFSSNNAGIGLSIMAVGGFAKYMSSIGASEALVKIAIKPLRKLNAPYLVLALGYAVGQFLNIFIPSATGLGILLMVTMYPILVSLGVSPLAATAMIGTSACLDLGPASGNSILAADTAKLNVSLYFIKYQIPVAIAVVITISILHYFVQKWFDKKSGHIVVQSEMAASKEGEKVPKIYAILPLIPLIILLIFSQFLISTIKLDVVTAMLMSTALSMIFELIRYKDVKKVFASIQVFFDEMGVQFAKVVSLIVAGQTFAHGLKTIGAIDVIISSAQSSGFGTNVMVVIMVLIITVCAIIMGSGNAPFFAFASLAPEVALKAGIPSVIMLMPMQLAAGIARSMSPITSVIVGVSGISEVSPFEVAKRTLIPMLGALIVTVISTFILF
ncbi:C4-dicarboxylate transporter DcuC [Clostridium sp. MSJ-11]|uniref:C4-dicarboxylate transporter DcuC n=1 Tax=Clostridium mobile TaxID=2841512 RepID=A0ABS6EF09_9CLOT|nr:C4-dicarboxylate transporter DcuC [Clostridium mobile]MBU5483795.1 C4-dicarboxylate transporter DcuC [Clostridium mobile]